MLTSTNIYQVHDANMEMGLEQMGDVNQIGAPCRWADVVIAVSLIVVSVCGTLCNCLALTFFAKEFIAARNTSKQILFQVCVLSHLCYRSTDMH